MKNKPDSPIPWGRSWVQDASSGLDLRWTIFTRLTMINIDIYSLLVHLFGYSWGQIFFSNADCASKLRNLSYFCITSNYDFPHKLLGTRLLAIFRISIELHFPLTSCQAIFCIFWAISSFLPLRSGYFLKKIFTLDWLECLRWRIFKI